MSLPSLKGNVEGLRYCQSYGLRFGLLCAEKSVTLELLGLMVTGNIAEDFVVVGVYSAVGHSEEREYQNDQSVE